MWEANAYPESPSTQYCRDPKRITRGVVFGTRVLKYWLLGPLGIGS